VILAVVTAFVAITATNAWLLHGIAASLPAGATMNKELPPLDPVSNLVGAFTSHIFVIAAVFVAGSALARERESGTLAWVASKPVTRASIWVSKWVSSTAILAVVAGLVPLAVTTVVVTVLYGVPSIGIVLGLAIGLAAVIAFFVALSLALGTVVPGQAPTIAAVFTIFALMSMLAGAIPSGMQLIPTAMLTWPAAVLAGEAVPWATPLIWFVSTAGLAAFAIRRMGRIEL
jgi:ABC-2 type transport system permease protein